MASLQNMIFVTIIICGIKIKFVAAVAALFWIVLATSTSLIPKSRVQKSATAAAEFGILDVASYQYFFNTKIKNLAATTAQFSILLAIIIYRTPKFKFRPRQRPSFEFC